MGKPKGRSSRRYGSSVPRRALWPKPTDVLLARVERITLFRLLDVMYVYEQNEGGPGGKGLYTRELIRYVGSGVGHPDVMMQYAQKAGYIYRVRESQQNGKRGSPRVYNHLTEKGSQVAKEYLRIMEEMPLISKELQL